MRYAFAVMLTGKQQSSQAAPVHLYVESKIRIRVDELPYYCVKKLIRATTHRDPLYAIRRRQGISTAGMDPQIKTYGLKDGMLVLWRGMLGKTLRTIKAAGLTPHIHDNRLWLPRVPMDCRVDLRGYQRDPVHVMLRRQQTVGRAPAGSGKTEMLLAAAAHFAQPTLVLVWQERQQQVWLERIPRWFGEEAGGIGGAFKKPVLKTFTVGMVQSVRNRLEQLKWSFGCVICDEVNRFAAPTLREVVNNLPAAVRLGASDDERRRDGREFLLYDTFGPRGWRLGKSVGQCPVDIVTVPTSFGYKEDIPEDWTTIIEDLTTSESRNKKVLDLATREAQDGHRVLVWSDRLEHCHYLKAALQRRGVKAGLLIGGKEHKPEADKTEQGLVSGSISVGIGTTVAEQSINIPPLDRGIMTCASADAKLLRFRQMRGRLARPFEGKESRLYYLWDRRVPMLRRRVYNIRRRYHTREVCPVEAKETTMAEKAAVTIDTLKVGCKLLGIKAPRDATTKTLDTLIKRELSKDKTYGVYCCGACFRDIRIGLTHCPFCTAKFMPTPEVEDEKEPEEEAAEEEAEEEAAEELEEDAEEETAAEDEELTEEDEGGEVEGDEEASEDEDEVAEEDDAEEAAEEAADEEAEADEDEVVEDEEIEEPPKKVKKPVPAPVKKGGAVDKLKEQERAEKREQIRSELPYAEKALKGMKPSTLVMIATILGHKDPVHVLKTPDKCIQFILKAQKGWEKPAAKPIVKKLKTAPAKPTSKPAVKKVTKK